MNYVDLIFGIIETKRANWLERKEEKKKRMEKKADWLAAEENKERLRPRRRRFTKSFARTYSASTEGAVRE